ncbi:MAG: FecCD family ABC transporter permease, partial [Bacillota bacterium]
HLWPGAGSVGSETADAIIWSVRLPRVLLGVLIGGSLAVSGAVFQGLLRNPMADPYVLGISAGASLGAALAMTLATRAGLFTLGTVPLFAFVGSLLAVAMVYRLGRVRGQLSILTLLLAGVAVSTVLSSIVSFLVYFSGDKFQPLIYWLMGGLGGRGWNAVLTTLPYLAIGSGLALVYSRHLNAMSLGDEAAHHLGVPVARVRLILVCAGSLLAAAAVSAGGIIGFVGLLVPHILRLIIGADHRLLIPASLLAGGTFLTLADTIARTLMAPTELPVGIVTALCGGPVFLYLLRRKVA